MSPPSQQKTAHIVFVHGAWGGPDDYAELEAAVRERDGEITFVDLPSMRDVGADLAADVAEIGRVLDTVDRPKVAVGHSYGGMPLTGAAAGRELERLVYLAAFVPSAGDSAYSLLTSVAPARQEQVIQLSQDGTSYIDPWPLPEATERFGAQAAALMASRARRPQAVAAGVGTLAEHQLGWREHRTTYVLATRDDVVPPGLQRTMAEPLDELVEIATNHFPNIEAPDELAALLLGLAGRAAT